MHTAGCLQQDAQAPASASVHVGGRQAVQRRACSAFSPTSRPPPLPSPTAGLALGVMMSRSTRVREDMFIDAARALARFVPEPDRAAGALMPPVAALREVSGALRWCCRRACHVAAA